MRKSIQGSGIEFVQQDGQNISEYYTFENDNDHVEIGEENGDEIVHTLQGRL